MPRDAALRAQTPSDKLIPNRNYVDAGIIAALSDVILYAVSIDDAAATHQRRAETIKKALTNPEYVYYVAQLRRDYAYSEYRKSLQALISIRDDVNAHTPSRVNASKLVIATLKDEIADLEQAHSHLAQSPHATYSRLPPGQAKNSGANVSGGYANDSADEPARYVIKVERPTEGAITLNEAGNVIRPAATDIKSVEDSDE